MRGTPGLPFNQMTAEKRAEISRKGVEARNLKSMTWDWSREMPRLRANVRADVQAEVDAMKAEVAAKVTGEIDFAQGFAAQDLKLAPIVSRLPGREAPMSLTGSTFASFVGSGGE